MADLTAYPCPCCQIGYYQPGKKTYLRMHGGMLVSVPDMLVWICDICQHEEFDRDEVQHIEALLGAADTSGESQRSAPKTVSLEIPEAPPSRRMKS